MKSNNDNRQSPAQRLGILAQTGLFLATILAVQFLSLPNWLTGSAVNAVFIFVFLHLGRRYANFLAVLSPPGALISGHLPPVMYPLLPVIIIGNLLLINTYFLLFKGKIFARYLVPSLSKAAFIFVAGMGLIRWFDIGEKVKWLILPVIGVQIVTALAGIFIGEKLYAVLNCRGENAASELGRNR
ncbi:MAG: hypothetical protein Kow0029_23350 [Candidatus Rifleibacteriota bacterium]